MVPSLDTQKLSPAARSCARLMEKQTGLKYKVSVPTSYTAVITAMGAGNVDVGWLSPIPYVIAHDRYGVEVVLTTVRNKSAKYWSFIIARTDSGINKLADLKGKRFAYGDPVSTSGAIYPKHLIRTSGYDPEKFFSNVIYAGAHDRVVMAVYNKQVDAGAIYGGVGTDAREKVVQHSARRDGQDPCHREEHGDTQRYRKRSQGPAAGDRQEDHGWADRRSRRPTRAGTPYSTSTASTGSCQAKDSDYDSVRKVAEAENIKLEQIDKKK